jgi:hypothetical protein
VKLTPRRIEIKTGDTSQLAGLLPHGGPPGSALSRAACGPPVPRWLEPRGAAPRRGRGNGVPQLLHCSTLLQYAVVKFISPQRLQLT